MKRLINDPALIADMQEILPVARKIVNNEKVRSIEAYQVSLLKRLWEVDIMPGGKFNASCSHCVTYAVAAIVSWWDRGVKKHVKKFPEDAALFEPTIEANLHSVSDTELAGKIPVDPANTKIAARLAGLSVEAYEATTKGGGMLDNVDAATPAPTIEAPEPAQPIEVDPDIAIAAEIAGVTVEEYLKAKSALK